MTKTKSIRVLDVVPGKIYLATRYRGTLRLNELQPVTVSCLDTHGWQRGYVDTQVGNNNYTNVKITFLEDGSTSELQVDLVNDEYVFQHSFKPIPNLFDMTEEWIENTFASRQKEFIKAQAKLNFIKTLM